MALITVRPKNDPEAPPLEVDERWLERWPDDFEEVRDEAETAASDASQGPATQPQAPKGTDSDAPADPSARGRF